MRIPGASAAARRPAGYVVDDEDGYVEYLIEPPRPEPAAAEPEPEPVPEWRDDNSDGWQKLVEDRAEPDIWVRQLITEPIPVPPRAAAVPVSATEPVQDEPPARHRLSDAGLTRRARAGHRRAGFDDATGPGAAGSRRRNVTVVRLRLRSAWKTHRGRSGPRAARQIVGEHVGAHHHRRVLGAADGDAEPIPAEQGRFRARHRSRTRSSRKNTTGACWPWELVHGAGPQCGQPGRVETLPQQRHLRVVGRDDQHVGGPQRLVTPCLVGPVPAQQATSLGDDRLRLFDAVDRNCRDAGSAATGRPAQRRRDGVRPLPFRRTAAVRHRDNRDTAAHRRMHPVTAVQEVTAFRRQRVWSPSISQPSADSFTGSGWVP